MTDGLQPLFESAGSGMGPSPDIELSVNDILDLARQMEKRGGEFYQSAAATAPDAVTAQIFAKLARMEMDHEGVMEGLRALLVQPGAVESSYSRHWPGIASLLLSSVQEDLALRFAGLTDRERILRQAMEFEKDSVVFYAGLREMLARDEDRRKVDAIIREETGHILWIGSQLAAHARARTGRKLAAETKEFLLPGRASFALGYSCFIANARRTKPCRASEGRDTRA